MFSVETFAELHDRLWRPEFDRYLSIELRQSLLRLVDAIAHWVEVPSELSARRHCRDGDDDLLVLRKIGDTRIVNPRTALNAFLQGR